MKPASTPCPTRKSLSSSSILAGQTAPTPCVPSCSTCSTTRRFSESQACSGRRWPICWLAAGRSPPVRSTRFLGGKSPLLENTEAQARAIEAALGDMGEVKAFIAMRYWHPMSDETADQVRRFDPDRIVLLPLYPQFSTTTTASSEKMWFQAAKSAGSRQADGDGLLLSDRTGLHQGGRRPDPLRHRGSRRPRQAARAVLLPRTAEEGRPGRRSVPVAMRAHGRGDRARAEHPRIWTG